MRRFASMLTLVSLAVLSACGGGGGGTTHLPAISNAPAANTSGSAPSAPSASTRQAWTVDAGASHRDGALQGLDFYSSTIVIDEGDSVTWTSASIHTVSFLTAGMSPFTAPPVPAGGSTEDGSTFTSSGVLGPGQTYTLTFPKAGTYTYYCLLHPPEMAGQIIVQPAGAPYPHPQGYYTGQGNQQANADLSAAQSAIALFPFERGGTMLAAGISPGLSSPPPSNSSVWRFLDTTNLTNTVTIPVNATITWVNESNNEPHTVTFPIAGQPLPPLPGDPFTPPMGIVQNGVNIYDGTQVTNSGPFGTAVGFPGNSYSLKFTKAGTYRYFCLFHDEFGMEGTVVVQ